MIRNSSFGYELMEKSFRYSYRYGFLFQFLENLELNFGNLEVYFRKYLSRHDCCTKCAVHIEDDLISLQEITNKKQ